MQTLAMSRARIKAGYTLIEILIVLVLLGLLVSLVIPNVSSWIQSREKAIELKTLQASLSLLPLKALSEKTGITFKVGESIDNLNGVLVTETVRVLPNGYCKEGEVEIVRTKQKFKVTSPFCQLAEN